MSDRTKLPYVMHSERMPDGTALHTLANLTRKDMAMIADLLLQRRAINTIRIQDGDLPGETQHELQVEAERVDQLHRCLRYIGEEEPLTVKPYDPNFMWK